MLLWCYYVRRELGMAGAATPPPPQPPTPPPPPAPEHHPPRRAARLGIRARLWLAFVAIAGTTVLVSLLAWATFSRTAESLNHIAADRIPAIIELSRLAQRSNALIAGAAAVVFTGDEAELAAESARVAQAEIDFLTVHRRVQDRLGDTPWVREVGEVSARISANLLMLRSAMQHRWAKAARQDRLLEMLEVLHQEYRLLVGEPAANPARRWTFLTEINRLLVALGSLRETTSTEEAERQTQRIESALESVRTLAREQMAEMPPASAEALHSFVSRLRLLAEGEQGLPALRMREMLAREVAAARLADLQVQAAALDDAIGALTTGTQTLVATERDDVVSAITRSRATLLAVAAAALLAALLIGWLYVGRSVVGRIARLDHSMRAIAAGDLDHPIPVGGRDEVAAMGHALTTFRDAMAHVAHLARHDPLTGLGNRNAFDDAITTRAAAGAGGAVLYLNLDGFKDINDTFGHSTGDRVLEAVAHRLQRRARPGDMVARLGGDDFVIVAPGLLDAAGISGHVDTLARALGQPVDVEGLSIEVKGTFGISLYPRDGTTPSALLQRAEMAMHTAKREAAEGPVRVYTPRMAEAQQARKAIRGELRRAIDNGQFQLHYQPKIAIASGHCVGMEALVRWDHPTRGRIGPDQFIPVAERSGLIAPLGDWVMAEACRQNRAWMDAGLPPLKVAVNVSAVQFLCQDVVEMTERALSQSGLAPEHLEVEITESVIMTDETKVMRLLDGLRGLGVSLAIDDFGTGYSSLSYLKRLQVHCLKIDQSFVREMLRNEDDVRITRAILNIARDFGLEVVAEGIETAEHVDFFRAEGCHLGQGYFWGKPMPANDFAGYARTAGAEAALS